MNVRSSLLVIGFMLVSISHALADDETSLRDLTVEQVKAYKAGSNKQSSLQISASVDRRDVTYARGDTLKLRVKTNEDAFVTVFNIGPAGKVTRLFPNRFQKDNLIKANHEAEVPSAGSKTEIKVSGDVGGEVIKVIATTKPIQIIPESILVPGEVFSSVEGDVPVFVRNLEVATTGPTSDKVSSVSLVIKTVATR
jgi:Domain of unknown function (DUF4384)